MSTREQQALDFVFDRTRRARDRQTHLFQEPVTYDAMRVSAMMERFEDASPGPWINVTSAKAMDNWPVIFTAGADYDGTLWAVTTDGIHASEKVSGGAREDSTFVAHSWEDMRYLIRLVQQQQDELWRLRNA